MEFREDIDFRIGYTGVQPNVAQPLREPVFDAYQALQEQVSRFAIWQDKSGQGHSYGTVRPLPLSGMLGMRDTESTGVVARYLKGQGIDYLPLNSVARGERVQPLAIWAGEVARVVRRWVNAKDSSIVLPMGWPRSKWWGETLSPPSPEEGPPSELPPPPVGLPVVRNSVTRGGDGTLMVGALVVVGGLWWLSR